MTNETPAASDDHARFFEGLAQPAIARLHAYDPGHDLVALRRQATPGCLTELGSNENPDGPSPSVRQSVLASVDDLHRYPDPRGGDLKRALATTHGVAVDQIILGNGSHELLMQLAQVFAGPGGDVVVPEYGFAVFAIAARAVGARVITARALPVDAAMPRGHDLDAIADAITAETRLVFVANPNNPTGTWFSPDQFAAFMARVPGHVIVVVDEAYAELVDAADYASALGMLAGHRNLLVTRTFSKAYALAGLRIGYAIAHPGLVAVLERIRESFNLGTIALAAAEAALADASHLRRSVKANALRRGALKLALQQRGWQVSPSQTNFLLVEFGPDARRIDAVLLSEGVVLRPMEGYGLPTCLRISVGSDEENTRLLAALDKVCA